MDLDNIYRIIKTPIKIIAVLWLLVAIPNIGLNAYQNYSNYKVCSSLEEVVVNPKIMKSLSEGLENYLSENTVIGRKQEEHSKEVEFIDNNSIDKPIDYRWLGLSNRISHYVVIDRSELENGIDQVGVWVMETYLGFKVISLHGDDLSLDWKNPILDCWNSSYFLNQS